MAISREEMQEIVKRYTEPIGLNLGSHSALDSFSFFSSSSCSRMNLK